MLCDGRMVCGCADPYGKRVLGDAKADGVSAIWTGDRVAGAAPRPQRRRLEVLRRLPAEAAARRRTPRRPSAISTWRRCRRASTSSARPPATSRAPRRAARRRPASRARARPACSTSTCSRASSTRPGRRSSASTSSTTARRSCTSAPSRCASTSRPASRTSTSTRAPTASPSPRNRSGGSCTPGIDEVTFSIDGATADSYAEVPAARRLRQGDPQPADRGGREAHAPAATCRSSTGATSSSRTTTATRRCTLARDDGGRDRRRSAVLGAHRSSGGHVLAALRAGDAATRRHPARDLGRQQPRQRHPRRDAARARSTSAARCRGLPLDRRAAGRPLTVRTSVRNLSTRPFPAQATYGRRLVRARRAAVRRATARSSTATTSAPGCPPRCSRRRACRCR